MKVLLIGQKTYDKVSDTQKLQEAKGMCILLPCTPGTHLLLALESTGNPATGALTLTILFCQSHLDHSFL